MQIEPEDLTSSAAVDAAVGALVTRNQAHLRDMGPDEREEAMGHWRELALEVLSATRHALSGNPPQAARGAGRAVIVLEDAGGDEVAVSASFVPDLDQVSDDEVTGTPAQVAALSLLEALAEDPE